MSGVVLTKPTLYLKSFTEGTDFRHRQKDKHLGPVKQGAI